MVHRPTLSGKFILRGQALGFSALLLLMWLVELLRLPHRLYGEPDEINWLRLGLRTLIIAITWLIVHLTTKHLLRRLHELEDFLHVCSWCRRVGHDDQWLTMEEYFGSKFNTLTSHGICPDCAEKQLAAFRSVPHARSVAK